LNNLLNAKDILSGSQDLPIRKGKRPVTIRGPLHVQCSNHGDYRLLRQLVEEVAAWPGIEASPNVPKKLTTKIRMLGGGRFYSERNGTTAYYDSRHKVLKVPCEGAILELVQERTESGYRNQLLSIVRPNGHVNIMEY
jgi:hypothetical protein